MFLIDRRGRVVVSTDVTQEGERLSQQPYFQRGLEGSHVHLVPPSSSQDQVVAIAVRPIDAAQGEALGVLVEHAALLMENVLLRRIIRKHQLNRE